MYSRRSNSLPSVGIQYLSSCLYLVTVYSTLSCKATCRSCCVYVHCFDSVWEPTPILRFVTVPFTSIAMYVDVVLFLPVLLDLLFLYNNLKLMDLTGLENVASVGTITLYGMPHRDFSWLTKVTNATRLQILLSSVSC